MIHGTVGFQFSEPGRMGKISSVDTELTGQFVGLENKD